MMSGQERIEERSEGRNCQLSTLLVGCRAARSFAAAQHDNDGRVGGNRKGIMKTRRCAQEDASAKE